MVIDVRNGKSVTSSNPGRGFFHNANGLEKYMHSVISFPWAFHVGMATSLREKNNSFENIDLVSHTRRAENLVNTHAYIHIDWMIYVYIFKYDIQRW